MSLKSKKNHRTLSQVFKILILIMFLIQVLPTSIASATKQTESAVLRLNATTACSNPTDLGGTIFRDLDHDGVNDISSGSEYSFYAASMTVSAYDDDNNLVATQNIQSDGTYSFDDIFASNTHIRLEFAGLPDYMEVGFSGADNGTETQFHSAGTCNADLAVNNPADYCQLNPDVAITCFVSGDQSTASDTLVTTPYDASAATINNEAYATETGSIFGVAYNPNSETIYSASFLKRHVGFGPSGIDAIYATTASTTTTFIELNDDLGINTGTEPTGRDLTGPTDPSYDANTFTQVGKIGLGDIDFDKTTNTLWVVNLFDGRLYGIENIDGTTQPVAADLLQDATGTAGFVIDTSPAISCNNGQLRPFAIDIRDGSIFVGAVCSGENGSTSNADLSAHILSMDLANTNSGFTEVFTFPLDYGREKSRYGGSMPWQTWYEGDVHFDGTLPFNVTIPILADIEFDNEGSIIISLVDRYSHMVGPNNYFPDPDGTDTSFTGEESAGGDILRVCNVGGTYALEGSASCPSNPRPAGEDSSNSGSANRGPGGGEFYVGDYGPLSGDIGDEFAETTNGGLAFLSDGDVVMVGAFDPINYHSGGAIWLDNSTGANSGGRDLYNSSYAGSFGKAGGIGDLALECELAPFEIGNYVWHDANSNGIQDASEIGIGSVTITLHDMDNTGTQVGTATTDANGFYYFGGINDTNMTSGSLLTSNNYEIRIDTTQSAITTPNYSLTTANVAQPANGNASDVSNSSATDIADSDGLMNGDNAVIALLTGNAGNNNYGLDFGFSPPPAYDWGDLPDTDGGAGSDDYSTNSTDGASEGIGPSHIITTDMYLGSCVDSETNGQPSAAGAADQDDANGAAGDAEGTCATTGDDEDGIVFKTPLIAGEQACVDITVSTATAASSVVNGWIDFNSNGLLDDAGEQVFTNLDVDGSIGAGTYEHCFTVPSTITHGDVLYSRFRLNDDGFALDDTTALAPTGPADTGEVEDYALDLGCVGNYVWLEGGTPNDIQDAADSAFPGMTITLTWGGLDGDVSTTADNETYTTTTDNDGKYHFCGLLEDPTGDGADEYQISVDITDSPVSLVTQDSGADNALDSDVDGTGVTAPFTVPLPNAATDSATNDVDPENYAGTATDLTFDLGFTATRIELGDLPDGVPNEPSYLTLFGSGATHILFPDADGNNIPEDIGAVRAVWAGDLVDAEGDGQPAANTDGDDNDGTDDEDGVVLPSFTGSSYWIQGTQEDFTVTGSANAAGVSMDFGLWIDWNEDGDFVDSDEFYTGSITTGGTPNGNGVYQGSATVAVTMPVTYNIGVDTVFIRLRMFSAGAALAPVTVDSVAAATVGGSGGTALNGEVEDYNTIFLAAPTAVSLQDGGTTTDTSAPIVSMLLGLFAVLFITGVGIFARFRKQ